MASTTAQPLVLPPPAACLAGSDDTNIPAVLLRAPCDLEVLIPARNEARRLPNTLERTVRYLEAQPYSSSVVVIDNGSVDQTADLAARNWSERVPVHLTGCARPGKGAAVRRGFLTSRARFIGYMDADLATPIETLDVVMPLLREHPAADPMAERDRQISAITQEFPGWEAWQGLDGRWYARIPGAIPPVMVHAGSASDLIGQIRSQGPVTGREDVRALHGELGGGLQLKQ